METAVFSKNLLGKKNIKIVADKYREKSTSKKTDSKINVSQLTNKQIVDTKQENLLDKIEKNLESTRIFIKKMEKCKDTIKDPSKMLKTMENLIENSVPKTSYLEETQDCLMNKETLPYFKSLNKIEDTIKFLEYSLKENTKETIQMTVPKIPSFFSQENEKINQKKDHLSSFSNEIKSFMLSQDFALNSSKKSNTENNISYSKAKKITEASEEKEINDERNEEEKEDVPISFNVTAKSKSQDEDVENQRDSFFNSLIQANEIQINQINPELFFKNLDKSVDSDKENWDDNIKNEDIKLNKVIFSEIVGKNQKTHPNIQEEEDHMIEKLKNMLKNTKNELTKMHEINFDFPNYQIIGLQNKENKDINIRNEKRIEVEPKLKCMSSNSNFSVRVNCSNNVNLFDKLLTHDEEEMPRNYNVIRADEKKLN